MQCRTVSIPKEGQPTKTRALILVSSVDEGTVERTNHADKQGSTFVAIYEARKEAMAGSLLSDEEYTSVCVFRICDKLFSNDTTMEQVYITAVKSEVFGALLKPTLIRWLPFLPNYRLPSDPYYSLIDFSCLVLSISTIKPKGLDIPQRMYINSPSHLMTDTVPPPPRKRQHTLT